MFVFCKLIDFEVICDVTIANQYTLCCESCFGVFIVAAVVVVVLNISMV